MKGLFGRNTPAYAPPAGVVTMDEGQFVTTVRVRDAFRRYAAVVGAGAAERAVRDLFAESRRRNPQGGFLNVMGNAFPVHSPNLRFDGMTSAAAFLTFADTLLAGDLDAIARRRTLIADLNARRKNGALAAALAGATEPEASYFTPKPPPLPVRDGSRPPVPGRMSDYDKAKAWLTKGIVGPTTAFEQTLVNLAFPIGAGTFPLGGNDHTLRTAWQTLVPGAPAYRGWNLTATAVPYPSNVGGALLLNEVLAGVSGEVMPARGADAWYGLALYVFAALIAAQPFTDGNKRMGRLAYVLILLSGAVAFRAPTGALGDQLTAMR